MRKPKPKLLQYLGLPAYKMIASDRATKTTKRPKVTNQE